MAATDQAGQEQADASDTETPMPRLGALGYPNYRRFWIANVARVFGLQFRFIGGLWLAQQLEGSTVWLGIVSVAGALPTIVLSVPAGVIADRFDNKQVLVVSQALTALAMFVMAVLIVLDVVNVWMLMAWSVIVGSLMALGNPAQNAILPRLIEMRAIASAVAYTSGIWNVMRIVGPAGAGVLIALIGTGQAFFVTAAGFAVSCALIQSLQLAPLQKRPQQKGEMLEGISYILGNSVFFATIGLSFFTSLFGMSYVVLLPDFAEDVMRTDVTGFGFMEAAAGIGSLIGTILLVRVGKQWPHGPLMLVSAALFGVLIAGFAATRSLVPAMVFLFAGGIASSIYLNIGMTALQLQVPEHLRGRVMGVWSMTWFLSAVGGLPAGLAAAWLGTPFAVASGALSVTALALVLLATVPSLRRLSNAPRPSEVAAAS